MNDAIEPLADTTTIAEAIGGGVRRWRSERNWTLAALAERSGVSRRTRVRFFETLSAGEPVIVPPDAGEVVSKDDADITYRCWNMLQSLCARIGAGTTNALFILNRLLGVTFEGDLLAVGMEV